MYPHAISDATIAITTASPSEYAEAIARYVDSGFRFVQCDDLRRLYFGSVGYRNQHHPLVWVRLPIMEVTEEATDESARDGHDGVCSRLYFDEPIAERFVGLDTYFEEFNRHKVDGHELIEATDPMCYRLAFVCATCQEIFRVDWDECITLGRRLECGADAISRANLTEMED